MAERRSFVWRESGRRRFAPRLTARNEEPEETQVSDWPDISAITLFVEDLGAARTFYEAAFGLPIHFEDPHSVVFKFGDTLLNLLVESAVLELISPSASAPPEAGSRVVLTLMVDDVDETCAGLAKRGIELLNGPMDRPWGIRTASFVDPNGYIWEIAK
jgi:catechol 2,3-dioxygenase-like lactoylglutathione lyase family enzyme